MPPPDDDEIADAICLLLTSARMLSRDNERDPFVDEALPLVDRIFDDRAWGEPVFAALLHVALISVHDAAERTQRTWPQAMDVTRRIVGTQRRQ